LPVIASASLPVREAAHETLEHAIVITPRAIRYWPAHRYLEAFTGRFEKRQRANAPP
jgi:hypothetical protein